MLENNKIIEAIKKAMSSEHCSYKSTKKYLATLPTNGSRVILGPGENAGVVDLGKNWALAFRIESHNHPTFINPYKGAASGVGGILRDVFTMGARPIVLLDFLFFGTDAKSKKLLWQTVRGIAEYGNCVGVPTVGGCVYFGKTYNRNCVVNIFAAGLVKKEKLIRGNALTPSNDLIYVGARTGKDGIGGAEMASRNLEALDESSVQDADPFLEKLLLESCCELAGTNWVEGMQDMGAAGLLCSTSEVVLRGRKRNGKNLGAKVFLNRVPMKFSDMSPIETLLSESQERMLIIGKREFRTKILNVFKKWDLEATVIGEVTNDGNYTLYFDQGKKKNLKVSTKLEDIFPNIHQDWPIKLWKPQTTKLHSLTRSLKAKIWHQYDWMVGTRTLKGPNQAGNYALMDIPEIGKELIITWSSDRGYSNINPKKGVEFAFDRCFDRIKNLGGRPLALVNCLNFGHPQDSMGAFVETVKSLKARCENKKVPVVGGNVSLYNAYKNHSIKPTLVLVMVGLRGKKN